MTKPTPKKKPVKRVKPNADILRLYERIAGLDERESRDIGELVRRANAVDLNIAYNARTHRVEITALSGKVSSFNEEHNTVVAEIRREVEALSKKVASAGPVSASDSRIDMRIDMASSKLKTMDNRIDGLAMMIKDRERKDRELEECCSALSRKMQEFDALNREYARIILDLQANASVLGERLDRQTAITDTQLKDILRILDEMVRSAKEPPESLLKRLWKGLR